MALPPGFSPLPNLVVPPEGALVGDNKGKTDRHRFLAPGQNVGNGIIIQEGYLQSLGFDPAIFHSEAIAFPTLRPDEPITRDQLAWVPGTHSMMQMRGHPIARTKMWFQDTEEARRRSFLRYDYTGWRWEIYPAQKPLSNFPYLDNIVSAVNRTLSPELHFNHAIVTRYTNGNDCIGEHKDKVRSLDLDAWILVIKTGATARDFAFSEREDRFNDKGEEMQPIFHELWRESLPPGTAVWMSTAANAVVYHGVPRMPVAGDSSSIVLRRVVESHSFEHMESKMTNARAARHFREMKKAAAK